jgi:N-acetylmuramoyl-L-alanine amidase
MSTKRLTRLEIQKRFMNHPVTTSRIVRSALIVRFLVLWVGLALASFSAEAKKRGRQPVKAAVPFTTVVVDPGHGGHDRGGIPENIIPEKDVALDVGKRLQKYLEAGGLRVVMTRGDDTFVSLGERVRIANAEHDAIFVSVHFNSALRVEARGVEVFYGSDSGASLARLIQEKLLTVTVNPDARPLKRGPFWVLRQTKCPAVLAECGFLTNCEDAEFALEEGSREKLAEQIARAVLEYQKALNCGG